MCTAFQAIPKIVLAPLLISWFGFYLLLEWLDNKLISWRQDGVH